MPRKPATNKKENGNILSEEKENKKVTKSTVTKKAESVKKDTNKVAISTTKSKTTSSSSKNKTTKAKSAAKSKVSKTEIATKSRATKASSKSRTLKSKVPENLSAEEITSTTNLTSKIEVIEYYDLPYRYNQTVVKVLAQTPTTLFIYWDISDKDRESFVKEYGNDFFNNTKPVLVVHNDTMHYSFEIEIDDFANSWYLHVNDANCKYSVELGRRPKYYNEGRHIDIPNNYLYVTSSNTIDAPNDHILFDKNLKTVYFKDVKTNIITAKNITSLSFLRNMGKIYNLYDLQSDFNKNNWLDSDHWQLDLKNPSSSSSPTFR